MESILGAYEKRIRMKGVVSKYEEVRMRGRKRSMVG